MEVSRRTGSASRAALVAGVGLLLTAPASAEPQNVNALEQALDARDSATETLRLWCARHQPNADASIHAEREPVETPPPPDVLSRLGSPPARVIHYRRVRLTCGGTTLSEADNWYRADRLTAVMNQTLERTDKPFGPVVSPLGLHRQPLSSERPPAGSGFVLRRRAVLTNDRGEPFSVVQESYTAAAAEP